MENVKKTVSLAAGNSKENVGNTSGNRTSQEARKGYFWQTSVSYTKSLPKPFRFDDFGGLVPPDRVDQEHIKKTLRENAKKRLRKT